jgi:hypothetical protein
MLLKMPIAKSGAVCAIRRTGRFFIGIRISPADQYGCATQTRQLDLPPRICMKQVW